MVTVPTCDSCPLPTSVWLWWKDCLPFFSSLFSLWSLASQLHFNSGVGLKVWKGQRHSFHLSQQHLHANGGWAQVTSDRCLSTSCLHSFDSLVVRDLLSDKYRHNTPPLLPRPAEPGQPGDPTEPEQNAEGRVRRQLPTLLLRGLHRGGLAEPAGPGGRHRRHRTADSRGTPPAPGGAAETLADADRIHKSSNAGELLGLRTGREGRRGREDALYLQRSRRRRRSAKD